MSTTTFDRILTAPKGSFFLLGPRGTGKSTWLARTFPKAHRIDLLDEALYQSYLADIGRFAGELRADSGSGVNSLEENYESRRFAMED